MANDNFTDLTEPEGGENEEKGKKKKPKSPKQPVEEIAEPGKKGKKAKKAKKKGKKLKIILIIVLVVLVAGFVFEEVYFNYLGLRDLLIDSVVKIDPEYGPRQAKLDAREQELDMRESGLNAREDMIESRESQNDRRSTQLDERERELVEREELPKPLYWLYLTEKEISDLQILSKAYSQMKPEAAAEILVQLTQPNDVAAILYFMNTKNSGAILAAMEPIFAATITEILLNK